MNRLTLEELLTESESEYLDFKRQYHQNTAKLIHDILCLANSHSKKNKYIVFGIDDYKNVVGIENDANRKKLSQISDLIKNSNFNHNPNIDLYTEKKDNHEVDILVIADVSDKPYFLIKQKKEGHAIINAGTVYTRNADRNVSSLETATDSEIERMYKERFGLDKTVNERMHEYLQNPEKWSKGHLHSGAECIYYTQFPEFTFAISNFDGDHEQFDESWATKNPDSKAYKTRYFLMYHLTVLKNLFVISCDGGRYLTVMPEPYRREGSKVNSYYYINNSLAHLANNLLQHHELDLPTKLRYGSFAIFDSADVARVEFDQDYNLTKTKYTHHFFDEDKSKFDVIKNNNLL
ncbi:RNA-binding domain-containing protein [Candidatus Berkiella aquae]|nr:ATP-binding protein [Candidatus Berkiella aquae]MCS5711459.1 ATP-binding protein [Candidatus Berkiella aquae]